MPGSRHVMSFNRAPRALLLALSAILMALPLVLMRGDTVRASAPQPRRTPKHKQSPTPSPSPTPSETETPSPSPSPSETESPSPSPSPSGSGDAKEDIKDAAEEVVGGTPTPSPSESPEDSIWWKQQPKFEGDYSTDELDLIAERAEELFGTERVVRDLYAPFILVGPASFSDTWGAIRRDGEHGTRPHLGQDIFCEMDAPVLATEPGTIEFGKDSLGGKVARLHHERGGYWYYAHLSDFADDLESGDEVETGDVIGYCGNTGNASGGSPHVHFGSYPGPENPVKDLVGWLRQAKREAKTELEELIDERIDTVSSERLFGEPFLPDPSEVSDVEEEVGELEAVLGIALTRR